MKKTMKVISALMTVLMIISIVTPVLATTIDGIQINPSYNADSNVSTKFNTILGMIKYLGIFLAVGSIPNSDLIDVDKDKGYIIVDRKCMSSNKYIYAIGDVIKKDIYQLTTASGEGSIAASEIINNLSIKN